MNIIDYALWCSSRQPMSEEIDLLFWYIQLFNYESIVYFYFSTYYSLNASNKVNLLC